MSYDSVFDTLRIHYAQDYIHGPFNDGRREQAKQADAWWSRHKSRAAALVTLARAGVQPPPDGLTLTPAQLVEAEEHLRTTLDLAPPSKPAREVFRPMWPMTLAQLEAMIAEAPPEPRKNPAPVLTTQAGAYFRTRTYNPPRALHGTAIRPENRADYRAVDGIAWRLSAPEGMPPIPRRGGVYSEPEAVAIRRWLEEEWHPVREMQDRANVAWHALLRAGVDPHVFDRVVEAPSAATWWHRRALDYQGYRAIPSAEGKSPRELHAAILAWGRGALEALRAVEALDPRLFEAWADPDAHMQALGANDVTKYAQTRAAEYIYGLPRYTKDYSAWLGPRARAIVPSEAIGTFKLSELIRAARASDDAYQTRMTQEEQARARETAEAVRVLRPLAASGKVFNRANILRTLPGYSFRDYHGTKHISMNFLGPSGLSLAHASAATVEGCLAQMRATLGLDAPRVNPDRRAAIRAALTPELLKEPYRSRVLAGACHPLTGHCYVASEAYYHLHGGKAAGLTPMSIQHEGGPHWWIRDAQGRDIDLTAEQFATPVPYDRGVGKGFLTREPSARARAVIARVQG